MNYRNTELKLDQIVGYLNQEKINLSPAFQRGHVWPIGTQRKLITNIVLGRPIPAIFLYKEASGSRYSYNILDGKQRIESLILFIAAGQGDFGIKNWSKYFFAEKLRDRASFWIQLPEGKRTFAKLPEEVLRDLGEYAIPTVEITLTDESHLDEIINLFVDINQQGVSVSRFDIVKAMGANNKLLKSVFGLIALKQQRQEDVFYKAKANDFTRVLKRLQIIERAADARSQVDRMWERLLEIALFYQSRQHRKPSDILKSFISGATRGSAAQPPASLKTAEQKALRKIFQFLSRAYATKDGLGETSMATDQTHFYTLITSLIGTELLTKYEEADLIARLTRFGRIISNKEPKPSAKKVASAIGRYLVLSSDRTADAPRREERQQKLLEILEALGTSVA
jgi:hypothetical protein